MNAAPDPESFIREISFRLVGPERPRDAAQRLVLDRPGGEPAVVLDLFDAPFDAINTEMPAHLKRRLRPLLDIPRMSTLATAGVLNRAVAAMPPGHSFVNVGVWQGFTFLSAMEGNPEVACIGVDNFSEFYGPRDKFMERLEARRGPAHRFFDMDYREYFAGVHDGPIGVYLYDGEHSYENQMHGLEAAEPYLAEDCMLIVDDTNRVEPRQATLDFVARRADEYSVVADIWTSANNHPTFWNGLLVVRRGGRPQAQFVTTPGDGAVAAPAPEPDPAVSIVVLDAGADSGQRARAVDAARAQTWPHVEVVVADAGDGSPRAALADALARTSAGLVAFIDTSVALRPDAVELSVAYPDVTPFWRPVDESRMSRAQSGIRAAADVDAVVPPGSAYLLVGDALGMPTTCAAGPGIPLGPQDLDDDAARAAVDRARGAGATHVVVLWNRFDWLAQRPGLLAHVGAMADVVLENRRVRVFRFRS
jgi:hypothetical protein